MRKIFATVLLFIGAVAVTSSGYMWFNQNQEVSLEPVVEALPQDVTSTTTTSTTVAESNEPSTTPDTVPPSRGDYGNEEVSKFVDYADPVSLEISRVDINDATIENVSKDQKNSCGRVNNPCFGNNMLDAWTGAGIVGVCETGASIITGHTTSGKGQPDTFTNLIDDPEFSYDTGVVAGDQVVAELADGSRCIGEVENFIDGPGEKLPDSPARFFEKLWLGEWVADELIEVAGDNSVGFLMTSYCGECRPGIDWYPKETFGDGFNHRRYTAVVKVNWTHQPAEERFMGFDER